MHKVIETNRFYLRKFIVDDAEPMIELNSNHKVLRYTGDKQFESLEIAKEFFKNYHYVNDIIGRYAVCDKVTHRMIGFCGLKYHKKENFTEIGYRFFEDTWNKGIATETALATLNFGFNSLQLAEIYIQVDHRNDASLKVTEKLDAEFVKDYFEDDLPGIPHNFRIQNPKIEIKKINAKDTYPLRHSVLRKGRPIEDCVMEADELNSTHHLGLFLDKKLISVATFMIDKNSLFKDEIQYRLRGMCVLEKYQKKGFGNVLLREGEKLIKNLGCTTLWFNARINAVNFYKSLGYTSTGNEFNIEGIGPHFVMNKEL